MHLTRRNVGKKWPVKRKGTKYVIVPSHNHQNGIPLLIVMRDILKIVNTRRELKRILHEKEIMINKRVVKEENRQIQLFDTISLNKINTHYRLIIGENRKFLLEEISEKEAEKKICKIISRKKLKGNKTQINLNDGRNVLNESKAKIGDSIELNLNSGKIERIIEIKEKAKVLVIGGKHFGDKGEIIKIENEKALVRSGEKEYETKISELMAVG
ncbi:MAG: hypothetical protein QXJ28_00770 [Candidatus Pacearchaeota archaeon]